VNVMGKTRYVEVRDKKKLGRAMRFDVVVDGRRFVLWGRNRKEIREQVRGVLWQLENQGGE